MSDFKDQQALSDGFPAQSGMIYEGMRPESQRDLWETRRERQLGSQDTQMGQFLEGLEDPERAGFMGRYSEPDLSAEEADRAYQGSEQQMMNREAFARQEAKDEWARISDIYAHSEAEGQVGLRYEEDFDRAYQGSEQQREDEARYRRGGK